MTVDLKPEEDLSLAQVRQKLTIRSLITTSRE